MGTAETRALPAYLSATYGFGSVRIDAAFLRYPCGSAAVAVPAASQPAIPLASFAELHADRQVTVTII